ncbi:Putative ammonium transporter, ammonium/urea transporter [Septoria linicola]|uniref:Ammonium transporter, ammonium/urea transporter n=1 Tax=Septoria linicola TaxID=215465 RepID=A0A9Q9EJW1_9PEZI|nr:Putative ammonium transporter, ammonium/urea transporter [Septoria linicola]
MSTFEEMFPAPEFDETMPWGGDSRNDVDVNAQYRGYEQDAVFIVVCTFLVWIMVPGLAMFYAGLSRRKSALTMLFQAFIVFGIITLQWMLWGYSLTYAPDASPFIGTEYYMGMRFVQAAPAGTLPDILFALYQLMFCAVTTTIVTGAMFERGNIIASTIFAFAWATIVYSPIACWTWNANGWLLNLGSLDYAGGGPVHIASGCSALAYALVLGKRKSSVETGTFRTKPHNQTLVAMGTFFIWFGWFGFNAGSALNASVRAYYAAFNTQAAAACGVLGWVTIDMIRNKGRFSFSGACEGAIAGLVGITPAAGYVQVFPAALIGYLTAVVCASIQNINEWIHIDEGMDVFKLHGVGGMVGSFLTGIFADYAISNLDAGAGAAGAWNGNGIQVAYQLADIYAPKYLSLRLTEEQEVLGADGYHFHDETIGEWMDGTETPRSTMGYPQSVTPTAVPADGRRSSSEVEKKVTPEAV